MKKIEPYISILVPLSVIVGCVNFLIGGFFSLNTIKPSMILFFGAVAFVAAIGAFNTLNSIYDIHPDSISKPYRPLPSLRIAERKAGVYYLFLTIVSLIIAFFISFSFLTIIFIITILAWLYSTKPRFKRRLYLNSIIVTFVYVLLPFFAGWSLFSTFLSLPWHIILIIGSLAFLLIMTKDITDVTADKITSVRTVLNVCGVQKAGKLLKETILIPYFLLLFFIFVNLLENIYLIALIPVIPNFYLMRYIEKNPNEKIGEKILICAMVLGLLTEILILMAWIIS